eukprot:3417435-Prymnesium_polylepis.1
MGTLPSQLGMLTALTLLRVSGFAKRGRVSGTVPEEIGRLTMLEALSLVGNVISGSLPTLPSSLVYLNAATNSLSGSIPSLTNLVKMEHLDIGSNFHVGGTLPTQLGSMTHLREE